MQPTHGSAASTPSDADSVHLLVHPSRSLTVIMRTKSPGSMVGAEVAVGSGGRRGGCGCCRYGRWRGRGCRSRLTARGNDEKHGESEEYKQIPSVVLHFFFLNTVYLSQPVRGLLKPVKAGGQRTGCLGIRVPLTTGGVRRLIVPSSSKRATKICPKPQDWRYEHSSSDLL